MLRSLRATNSSKDLATPIALTGILLEGFTPVIMASPNAAYSYTVQSGAQPRGESEMVPVFGKSAVGKERFSFSSSGSLADEIAIGSGGAIARGRFQLERR